MKVAFIIIGNNASYFEYFVNTMLRLGPREKYYYHAIDISYYLYIFFGAVFK